MPRFIDHRHEIEFNDGTRMTVRKDKPLYCPKCGARIIHTHKSPGCIILCGVILLVIIIIWLFLAMW